MHKCVATLLQYAPHCAVFCLVLSFGSVPYTPFHGTDLSDEDLGDHTRFQVERWASVALLLNSRENKHSDQASSTPFSERLLLIPKFIRTWSSPIAPFIPRDNILYMMVSKSPAQLADRRWLQVQPYLGNFSTIKPTRGTGVSGIMCGYD